MLNLTANPFVVGHSCNAFQNSFQIVQSELIKMNIHPISRTKSLLDGGIIRILSIKTIDYNFFKHVKIKRHLYLTFCSSFQLIYDDSHDFSTFLAKI